MVGRMKASHEGENVCRFQINARDGIVATQINEKFASMRLFQLVFILFQHGKMKL
jgi:hypothetical protein